MHALVIPRDDLSLCFVLVKFRSVCESVNVNPCNHLDNKKQKGKNNNNNKTRDVEIPLLVAVDKHVLPLVTSLPRSRF